MTQDFDKTEQPEGSAAESRRTPSLVEKFVIRLPQGLRNQIKQLSEQNRRSMNSEIIMVLEKHIQQNQSDAMADLEEFASQHEREGGGLTDKQLTEKLENLPAEKKEALLELLG